jgi:Spy/CpxP family protein refolding chaperone
MKKIITIALVLALSFGAAQAQSTDKGPGKHHRGGHEMVMKDLNLTPDQKARLKTIHQEQRKEMEALKSNTSLTDAQKKEQRKALHDKYRSQFESVLTPAQKAEMEKKKADWKAEGKHKEGKGKEGRAFKGGQRHDAAGIAKDLNLSADQKQKMQSLRTDFKSKAEALRNDKSLTAEQKKAKMQELKEQQKEQMKSVLTKEQQEKVQSKFQERRNKTTK